MSGRRDFGSVRRLPSGRWQARCRDGSGTAKSRVFGTRGDASRHLARVRTDIDRGDWYPSDAGHELLQTYVEAWLARRRVRGRPLAPRTSERYRTILRLHILPELGHLSMSRLSSAAVRQWHSTLFDAEITGPATLAKAYRLLHAICNTAVAEQKIPRNPCMIPGASVETHPERPIANLDQVYAIAEAVGERWRALVLLATFCGLGSASWPASPARTSTSSWQSSWCGRTSMSSTGSAAAGGGQVGRQPPYGVDSRSAARRSPPPSRYVRAGGQGRLRVRRSCRWAAPAQQLPQANVGSGDSFCRARGPALPRSPTHGEHPRKVREVASDASFGGSRDWSAVRGLGFGGPLSRGWLVARHAY